jgi:hypothetical protein
VGKSRAKKGAVRGGEGLLLKIVPSNKETRQTGSHSNQAHSEKEMHAWQINPSVEFLKVVDVWIFFHERRLSHDGQCVETDIWS